MYIHFVIRTTRNSKEDFDEEMKTSEITDTALTKTVAGKEWLQSSFPNNLGILSLIMLKFVKVTFKFGDKCKVIAISPVKIPAGIALQNS